MKHLFCHTVYQEHEFMPSQPEDMFPSIREAGADGLELLTGYGKVDRMFTSETYGVHLPYATDWYSGWVGDVPDDAPDERILFTYMGRDRNELVRNVTDAIGYALPLNPRYGVFHGSCIKADEIFTEPSVKGEDILNALAELMNSVASEFKGGEPPFTILLENLWWPGLRLLDVREYESLSDRMEFDNWGFCLDTGHMMNAMRNCYDEQGAIDGVVEVIEQYPTDMIDRIIGVHLHLSTSAAFIDSYVHEQKEMDGSERMAEAYAYVSKLDQHRPFTSPECKRITDILKPEHIAHEIVSGSWDSRISDFRQQRSLFI